MGRGTDQGWTIELARDAWRVLPPMNRDGELTPKTTFPPNQLVDQVAPLREALLAAGWNGTPPVLALGGDWCLAATLAVSSPQLLRKPQAMRYHLETAIPWSAEEYVSDYVARRDSACMAAVPIEPLKEFLAALDACDAGPAVVAPAATLALQHLTAVVDLTSTARVIWVRDDRTASCLTLKDGDLAQWREIDLSDSRQLFAEAILAQLADEGELPTYLVATSVIDREAYGSNWERTIVLAEPTWEDALRGASAALSDGRAEPLLNFRRDELAGVRGFDALRRETRLVVGAMLLLVAAGCSAMWLRGDAYQRATGQLDGQLVTLFESMFPDEPVPERGAAAKFRTEQQTLAATRGGARELPVGVAAETLLEKVLAALPSDLRYRVPELRIDGATVYLAGEVRSNADADRIAAALRMSGGVVAAPRLQRLAGEGFSVRLTAEFGGPDKEVGRR